MSFEKETRHLKKKPSRFNKKSGHFNKKLGHFKKKPGNLKSSRKFLPFLLLLCEFGSLNYKLVS